MKGESDMLDDQLDEVEIWFFSPSANEKKIGQESEGWYWQYCDTGCAGVPFGPFNTKQDAANNFLDSQ